MGIGHTFCPGSELTATNLNGLFTGFYLVVYWLSGHTFCPIAPERDDGLRIHEQHPLPETPPEMQAKHPASHDASRASRENRSPAARI